MNDSKPIQSRVPQRDVALCASFLGCLMIVSMAFSACSPASKETAASANASPSASGQTEARRQIEAASIGIWQAVGRGDAAAIVAEYADDALILGSGAPMLQGKPAVAQFLQGLFGGNTLRDVKGNVTDIMISGDLAVETGTYAMTVIPKSGNAVADKGKYIHVWKKSVDGSWKVVRYVPNSDIPPR
jgi:ketosteroid isomerase-like protein